MSSSVVRSFTEPDDFANCVRVARTELTVTGRGRFLARVTDIDLRGLWLQRFHETLARISHSAHGRGHSILTFRTQPGPPLYWAGVEMQPGCIIRHSEGQEAFQRSGGIAAWGAIAVPVDVISTVVATISGCSLIPPREMQISIPPSARMIRLLQLHAEIASLAEDAPETLAIPETVHAIEQSLLQAVAACLGAAGGRTDTLALQHQAVIMRRFRRALEGARNQAVYIPDLCAEIGVSERALRACCRDQLGMGPHRYLLLRRMHMARRALLHSAPAQTTVTEVATRYGFWQFGRFAQEFRQLFGELPSAALARAP